MTGTYRWMLVAFAVLGIATPMRAEGPGTGEVTAVSLAPAAGKTEVVVAVRGAVDVRDFLLSSPDRLVLDVVGATLSGTTATLYDGVKRGGVLNLRYSQFRPDVVRVVIDLEGPQAYKVDRSAGAIRVSFESQQAFQAWSSTDDAAAPAAVQLADVQAGDAAEVQPASGTIPARKPEMGIRSAAMLTRADEPRITVTWDRASIADVVAGFAAFSGRTIILGKDVKGEVNAEIKNQPWPQAFQAILATQGLSAQEMSGGIIRVDAPSALAALDSLEPLETSIVRINYAQAGSLAKTVESILTKNRGRVVADTGSNALILTDTRSRIASVTDFVRGLDIRTPQLSIQAKIIFVDRTDIEQLGLKYDLGSRTQFFNRLVQRKDPSSTTGAGFAKDVNIIDLGGNSVAAVGNADRRHPELGPRSDLLDQCRRVRADHVPERAGADRARGHPGRAGHLDARQSPGRHPRG